MSDQTDPPGFLLQQIREKAGDGGKKMSRGDFAKRVGLSMAKIRSIEQGKGFSQEEHEKITAVFPGWLSAPGQHESASVIPQDTLFLGQRCIQCSAEFSADGTVRHKRGCPDLLPKPAPAQALASLESLVAEAAPVEAVQVCLDEDELEGCDLWEVPTPQLEATELGKSIPIAGPFSNSEVQTAKRCRRKWWLRWYRGLEPAIQDPASALATGIRVHKALQARYVPEGQTPVDPRQALETIIESDWRAYLESIAPTPAPADANDRFAKAIVLERNMVHGYMQWLSETGVDSGLHVIAPEATLVAPLTIPDGEQTHEVQIIGRLDARVYREIDGVRLFVDHKTTASLTRPLHTIRMNEQMLHYHLLEWLTDISGKRCDGALYNMLRKVGRSERAKPPFYDRVEVRHNHYELESFRRRLVGVIRDIIRMRTDLDAGGDPDEIAYPTPNDNCSWDCEFLHVCTMFNDGSRVEDLIAKQYRVGNPLSRYRVRTNEE